MRCLRSVFWMAKIALMMAVDMPTTMSSQFHTAASWKTVEKRISR